MIYVIQTNYSLIFNQFTIKSAHLKHNVNVIILLFCEMKETNKKTYKNMP